MSRTKILFLLAFLTICNLVFFLPSDAVAWERVIPRSNCTHCGNSARGVVVDAAGDIIVMGSIDDSEVVKMSKADGRVIWRFIAYGAGATTPLEDLAIDSNGDVFVVAFYSRTVIKISGAAGTEIWRRLVSPTIFNAFQPALHAVAVDRDNNVVTAGTVGGLLNISKLRGTDGTEMWRYEREGDAFKVGIDPSGDVIAAGVMNNRMAVVKVRGGDGTGMWQKEVNVASPGQIRDSANALAIGRDGSVFIAGEAMSTHLDKDFTVAKYSSNGTQEWVQQIGGALHSHDDVANALVVDKNGDAIAAGKLSYGGGGASFFVTKISGIDSSVIWAKFAQDSALAPQAIYGQAFALSINAYGNVVAGGYQGSPSPRFTLVKFWGRTGGQAWLSHSSSTNGYNSAVDVVMDARSDVVAAGESLGSDGYPKYTVVKLNRKDGTSYEDPPPPPFPTPNPSLTPVIFIPGIAGTRLNIPITHEELWPGVLGPHDSLGLDPDTGRCPLFRVSYACYRPEVEVGDVIRSISVSKFYRPLLDMFRSKGYSEEEGPGKTLFIFAYDWRKSNTENAVKLKELVTNIHSIYPDRKVNIVTHSMGGLLARTYILDNPSPDLHNVNKLITIAAPWLGAPKVLLTLETGQYFEGLSRFLIMRNTLKTLVDFYPSVHELMPSPSYFHLGGFPFAEDQWDINGNGTTFENYSGPQMYSLINNRHPRSLPSYAGLIFHNRTGQDDWRNRRFGVDYYHIYGWKDRSETIQQVIAKRIVRCRILTCINHTYFDTKLGPGDGTVPVLSAARTTLNGAQNYNEENAVVLRVLGRETEHLELTQNSYVQQTVIAYLNAPPQSLTKKGNRKDNANRSSQLDEPVTQPAYYLHVGGAASAEVTDEAGDLTYPLGDLPSSGVPEVTSYLQGDDTFLAIMPTDDSFTLRFVTGKSPVIINLTRGTDVETAQAIRYLDLDLPAGTAVQLMITPEGVGTLQYDSNGDGTFDTPITPTASVTGLAARDTEAPIITLDQAAQSPTTTRVTITAADSGSGVKSLFYSLDGASFQPYVDPLYLDPAQTPVVYAFAEDNVANRSGLFTFSLMRPTAASVTVGGRVIAGKDMGVSGARVFLTDQRGSTRTALTNSFGYYRFDGVPAGATYFFTVLSKRYTFSPRAVTVNGEMDDLDFIAGR